MSLSNGNANGSGPGEPIPTRYMNPSTVSGGSSLPDRRRRGKNLGGGYYGNTGPRGDGRYQTGGTGYQRNHRGSGGSGDGPHNGSSSYHHHRGGDYDSTQQQLSPTESHESSRSNSGHHHPGHQGSMSHSHGQQQHHHYHQQQHSQHQHHQYHQQKQDYDGSNRQQDYRSQRGGGVGGGDQHHSHNQHHHHHHSNHYNNHHQHHRINIQTQPHQHNPDIGSVASNHPPQSSHSSAAVGYVGGNSGGGGRTSPGGQHQSLNGSATAVAAEITVITQPPPHQSQDHSYPNTSGNGVAHYQQQGGPIAPATVIQQYPTGIATVGPTGPTVGFYGYHPNSQPMLGSLALCHIPYGINPSSVISPVVYTQIIGSGMLTPGLPYNMACGIPAPFLQQAAPSAPMILQPTQHQHQQYSHQPHYHQHYHANPGQYSAGGHSVPNAVIAGGMSNQQSPHHHHHPQPNHQVGAPDTAVGEDDCVLFDSSSLLNPDADAFFPPAFPPASVEGGETVEAGDDLAGSGVTIEEEQIIVDDDDDEVEPVVQAEIKVDVHPEDSGSEALKSGRSVHDEDNEGDGDDEREEQDEDDDEEENEKCNTSGASKRSIGAGEGIASNYY